MHLSIHPVASFVDKLQSMSSVSMHKTVPIRNTSVTHEDHDLMDGFWVLRKIIPEHGAVISMGEMCGGIALLGMDEVRELGGIAQEENGCIVCHHIPVAFFSPEFDGETSRVSSTVVRSRFATDGRKADSNWTFIACLGKDVGKAEIIERLGAFEGTVCTAALGVDDALGDTLSVEVGDEVDEVEVLEEERAVCTGTLCFVRVRDRNAIAGGVDGLLAWGVAVIFVGSELSSKGFAVGLAVT